MHIEAVAWGAQRRGGAEHVLPDPHAGCRRTATPSDPGAPTSTSQPVLFFALGLLAKPTLVGAATAAADFRLLAGFDDAPHGLSHARRREASVAFMLALAVGIVTLVAQHHQGALGDLEGDLASALRFANAAVSSLGPCRSEVWPSNSSPSSTRARFGSRPGSGRYGARAAGIGERDGVATACTPTVPRLRAGSGSSSP